MLATEIISKLKKKIKIMWAVIIILVILLAETQVRYIRQVQKCDSQSIKMSNQNNKIIYDSHNILINKEEIIYRKRSRKGNAE